MTTPLIISGLKIFSNYFITRDFPFQWNSKNGFLEIQNPKHHFSFYLSFIPVFLGFAIYQAYLISSILIFKESRVIINMTANALVLSFLSMAILFFVTTLVYGRDYSFMISRAMNIERLIKGTKVIKLY